MNDTHIEAIDHLLTFVPELDAAARTFDALGFTVTPPSEITAMGITNRLILFRDWSGNAAHFIEMMAVTDAGRLPPPMAALLRGPAGIKSMVLSLTDPAAAQARFAAMGLPFGPPRHVRREWKIDASTSVWPEFDVLLPVDDVLAFNGCRYANVELYRRAEWSAHANGVTGFDRVLCSAADPAAAANRLALILGTEAVARDDGASTTLGGIEVHFERHPTAAARYDGYRLRGADLDAVRRGAETLGLLPRTGGGGTLALSAEAAFGQTLVFKGA